MSSLVSLPGQQATLRATCGNGAYCAHITPKSFNGFPSDAEDLFVYVSLRGVPPTCALSAPDEPCVPSATSKAFRTKPNGDKGGAALDALLDAHPGHWNCTFSGKGGAASTIGTPRAAFDEPYEGMTLAANVWLSCPLPTYAEIVFLTAYLGDASTVSSWGCKCR